MYVHASKRKYYQKIGVGEMSYTLPNFNLIMNWWDNPNMPVVDPPDHDDIQCQLYRPPRSETNTALAIIRVPPEYSVLGFPPVAGVAANPIVECPAGSGAYYRVRRGEWQHRGFPNEYIAIEVNPCHANGATIDSDSDLV